MRGAFAMAASIASVCLAGPGHAQQRSAAAASDVVSPTPAVGAPAAPAAAGGSDAPACPARPAAGESRHAGLIVTLDPYTLWRPRGGEVRFRVTGRSGTTVKVERVLVCVGWSPSPGSAREDAKAPELHPAPVVRPIPAKAAGEEFGAELPNLDDATSTWWPFRLLTGDPVSFTAVGTVPIADMVVQVTAAGGEATTVLVPIGVTNVTYAVAVVVACLGAFAVASARTARSAFAPGGNAILTMIGTNEGYASLSQFQILLWTVTIGAAEVYVMVLSGNLVNLSDGTLILLGIAGGVALAARIPGASAKAVPTTVPPAVPPAVAPTVASLAALPAPAAAPAAARCPRWSDLVVVGTTIDLTRVQMLVFTLISAAFVVLKVVVGYAIPDIPNNFLLLMGISNGVYVAGRKLPE